MVEATVWAPINIAVLKYWGKKDAYWNLPMNDSISITLDGENECLGTETTVKMERSEKASFEVYINGVCYSDTVGKKAARMLRELMIFGNCDPEMTFDVQVNSTNFSPTAAGLASSASGYAALTVALAACLGIDCDPGFGTSRLSSVARIGSGSACRSLNGGFVHWWRGGDDEPMDSGAKQLFPDTYWYDLGCLIIRLEYAEKDVPSTEGMKRTVETSDLSKHRYNHDYIKGKVAKFCEAIKKRDFDAFGELLMRDSNQFHALCLDSYPPINYLKPESWQVIQRVHGLNRREGRVVAAYTFDAGPHPVVFYQRADRARLDTIYEGINCKVIPCKVSKGAELKSLIRTTGR